MAKPHPDKHYLPRSLPEDHHMLSHKQEIPSIRLASLDSLFQVWPIFTKIWGIWRAEKLARSRIEILRSWDLASYSLKTSPNIVKFGQKSKSVKSRSVKWNLLEKPRSLSQTLKYGRDLQQNFIIILHYNLVLLPQANLYLYI